MADITPPSPDGLQLRGNPATSARLSKKAAFFAIAVLAVILGVIVVNVSREKPTQTVDENATKRDLQPALNAAKTLTKDVPDIDTTPTLTRQPPPLPSSPPVTGSAGKPTNPEADARLADSAVPNFSAVQGTALQPAVAGYSATQDEDATRGVNTTGGADSLRASAGAAAGLRNQDAINEVEPNRQEQKENFLQRTRRSIYLQSRLTAPVSPFELKTGTVIPGILIGAANSDLPGEIIAQVSQNVYDTATGAHLLIPQGTRLYGRYDSHVTFGQDRLLINWQRLIYPNAYTLELDGMSGHDQAGGAGFADRVNNHYGRIFGWALLTSVLSAGYQLSQPQQSTVLATQTNQQVAAAAVGQQMAQLGAQMAARNMQVQPTIEIRKGYRMNVMVNKDVIFPGDYQP
jgi:type IV secretion system protein VirB10